MGHEALGGVGAHEVFKLADGHLDQLGQLGLQGVVKMAGQVFAGRGKVIAGIQVLVMGQELSDPRDQVEIIEDNTGLGQGVGAQRDTHHPVVAVGLGPKGIERMGRRETFGQRNVIHTAA